MEFQIDIPKHLLLILMFVSFTAFGEPDDASIAERFESRYGNHANWENKHLRRKNPKDFGISEFGIQKTGCYVDCPSYSLIFKFDGSVQYRGNHHVERKGEGHINP